MTDKNNQNLDPEEIIEFEYYDRISKKKVLIKDKRKIKMALDEMDNYERKQRDLITKNECTLNENTDEIYSSGFEEFEKDLESAFQEVVDQIAEKQKDSEKIKKFLKANISLLTEKQLNVLFLYYFLDFSALEISKILNTSKQRISQIIKKINQKLRENAEKVVD